MRGGEQSLLGEERKLDHRVARLWSSQLAKRLVRRLGGGQVDHPFEPQGPPRLLDRLDVPAVNGIEATSEETDLGRLQEAFFAAARRCSISMTSRSTPSWVAELISR